MATVTDIRDYSRDSQSRVPVKATPEDEDWFRRHAGIPEEDVEWVARVWAVHYGPDAAS